MTTWFPYHHLDRFVVSEPVKPLQTRHPALQIVVLFPLLIFVAVEAGRGLDDVDGEEFQDGIHDHVVIWPRWCEVSMVELVAIVLDFREVPEVLEKPKYCRMMPRELAHRHDLQNESYHQHPQD
jgi:hypothetical protein